MAGELGRMRCFTSGRVNIGEVSGCSVRLGCVDGSINRSVGGVLRGLQDVVVEVCGGGWVG